MENDEDEIPDLERSSGKGDMTRSTADDDNDGLPEGIEDGSVSSGYGEESPLDQREDRKSESQKTNNESQD